MKFQEKQNQSCPWDCSVQDDGESALWLCEAVNRAQWKPNFPAAELKGGALLAHCIQFDVYHVLLRGGYRERERERGRKSSVGAIMWIILAGGREPACGCIKLNWHLLLLFNQATYIMLFSVVWLFEFSLDKQLIVIWNRRYSGNAKIAFWNYFDQKIKEGKTNQGLIW